MPHMGKFFDPLNYFEAPPVDGETKKGPNSDWAFHHSTLPAAHHAKYTDAEAEAQADAKIAIHAALPTVHQDVLPLIGWKAIGEYFSPPQVYLTLDPLPCSFDRIVKTIAQFSFGNIFMQINGDEGANYSYTYHRHGISDGVNKHEQSASAGANAIILSSVVGYPTWIEMMLSKRGNYLEFMARSFCYQDESNFMNVETGGLYLIAGPYTTMTFYNGPKQGVEANMQFFESVYVF